MCLGYESTRVSESLMAWTVTPPLANIVKRLREILKPGNKAKGKGGDLSIQYHTGALSNKPTQGLLGPRLGAIALFGLLFTTDKSPGILQLHKNRC